MLDCGEPFCNSGRAGRVSKPTATRHFRVRLGKLPEPTIASLGQLNPQLPGPRVRLHGLSKAPDSRGGARPMADDPFFMLVLDVRLWRALLQLRARWQSQQADGHKTFSSQTWQTSGTNNSVFGTIEPAIAWSPRATTRSH